jgi:hypothetical protein
MEFLNGASSAVIGLGLLLIGFILGGTVADIGNRRRQKRKEQREAGVLKGMTAPEAYLEGFNDAYHGQKNRHSLFQAVDFGDKYKEGYDAGHIKKSYEIEQEYR